MSSRWSLTLLLPLLACVLASPAARADDQPFVTLYSTDIDAQDEREFEQWLDWKSGHAGASHNEFLSKSEIEYGITDDLQGSFYVNYDWTRDRPAGGPTATSSLVGVSSEFIYRVMNVYFDPIGLAFYLEPSYWSNERGLETKILLQKNFFHDSLRLVGNVNFEDDWIHEQGRWDRVSALEFDAGAAYNITPEWSAGIEFDNERAFDGLIIGSAAKEATSAYYFGPTIQYVGTPFSITLGAETQLPWAGNPSHIPDATRNGFVSDAEHFRVLLRLTRDF